MNANGFYTLRINDVNDLKVLAPARSGSALMRGKRLSEQDYLTYFEGLNSVGISLINSTDLFELHNKFNLYYPLIKDFSPRSAIIQRDDETSYALEAIVNSGIVAPVFVRSEIESAAKYVGIQTFIMNDVSAEEFERCKSNLNEYVKGYRTLIVKEVNEIKKHNHSNLEYRAIVINESVVSFDYDSNKLPSPAAYGIDKNIKNIVTQIYKNGFKGAYFMDFAVTVSDALTIVESKDILNGTIKDIEAFCSGLN